MNANTAVNTSTTTNPVSTASMAQSSVKAVANDTLTVKRAVKDFFQALPYVAYVGAAGALSAYAFTTIPALGGAILLASAATIMLITFIACKLLLNVSDEVAFAMSIIASMFLVNVVAMHTFPYLGYPALSHTKISLFTAGTAISTFLFSKLFSGQKSI